MSFSKPEFSSDALAAAAQHALSEFPKESCGLIVGANYVPCTNIAEDPEKDFKIDPTKIIEAGSDLRAVIHSHPDACPSPSAADMQGQIDTGCIWGIIPCKENEALSPVFWGDFRLEEPLIGRQFLHGINDCGTLIRSWFWQVKNIYIPEFARDNEWWKKDQNIYMETFNRAGFYQIDVADVKEGDVFLGMVISKVPNHGGIFLGRGLGLHHLAGRLSARESILRYQRHITHWLRYRLPEGE